MHFTLHNNFYRYFHRIRGSPLGEAMIACARVMSIVSSHTRRGSVRHWLLNKMWQKLANKSRNEFWLRQRRGGVAVAHVPARDKRKYFGRI